MTIPKFLRELRLFQFKKGALFIKTPGVTGKASVRPQNAVAWNKKRNGVMADSSANGLGRSLLSGGSKLGR